MNEKWQELKETIIELRDNDGTGTQQEVCKFLANLMDVLEKQMQEPCGDTISRQAVSKLLNDGWRKGIYPRDAIMALPSVTPQQKVGRWIEHFDESGKWYECDQCHTDWGGPVNYCPNCGAKM